MIELVPKIADLKLLRELSKVIIVPMLIASYLIQSNFSIFGMVVNPVSPLGAQLFQFVSIFVVSSTVVGSLAWAVHDLLLYLQVITNFIALSILSSLFLAFGFLGVFSDTTPLIQTLDKAWFYTSFVCGFYLLARAADIERHFT